METGLSSDPPMNWQLSALDKITLVSNSDAHSPANLGREANVFEIAQKDLSYNEIYRIIKEKDKKKEDDNSVEDSKNEETYVEILKKYIKDYGEDWW